jgi:hypothetical protein
MQTDEARSFQKFGAGNAIVSIDKVVRNDQKRAGLNQSPGR